MASERPVCKYFLHGQCIRGATCHYAHLDSGCKATIKTVCFHYQQGSCRFGDQCRQTHREIPPVHMSPEIRWTGGSRPQANRHADSEQNNTAISCKFFERGSCAKGTSCPFNHAATSRSLTNAFSVPFGGSRHSTVPVQQPCKFFGRGQCMKGSGCKFLHSPIDVGPQPRPESHLTLHSRQHVSGKLTLSCIRYSRESG